MKFNLHKASDWRFEEIIEINTLDELIECIEQNNEDIIIIRPNPLLTMDDMYGIIIYDDYID